MAVESSVNKIGYQLPEWSLDDLSGTAVHLAEPGHPATLLAFVCNHCPYVRHIETAFGAMVSSFASRGLRTLAVMSNDTDSYPEDGIEGMTEQAARSGWDFPYLLDAEQGLALELGAVCTPDFFLFDPSLKVTYRGAFDAASPKNGNAVTGELLSAAIEHILAGSPTPLPHRPAMGCGIKWREGKEPEPA